MNKTDNPLDDDRRSLYFNIYIRFAFYSLEMFQTRRKLSRI